MSKQKPLNLVEHTTLLTVLILLLLPYWEKLLIILGFRNGLNALVKKRLQEYQKKLLIEGTLVHEYAERHFNGEDISDLALQTLDVRQMSHDLIKMAESGIDEVWGQEQVLWSNKYRYAGRTDMVGIWKGKPTIIDFKTSKKKKYVKQITDYFIQCCAYAVAHNELYGTGIRNMAVLITVDGGEPQIFEHDAVPYLPLFKEQENDV